MIHLSQNPSIINARKPIRNGFVLDAPDDNLIKHGINFVNWSFGPNSYRSSSGIYVFKSATQDYAAINIYNTSTGNYYWGRVYIENTNNAATTLRVGGWGLASGQWGSINGSSVTMSHNGTGFRYFKVYPSGMGPFKLVLENTSASNGDWIFVRDVRIYPRLSLSSDALFVAGDKFSSSDTNLINLTDWALSGLGAKNVLRNGDLSDTGLEYEPYNGALLRMCSGRGGWIYTNAGNHDYTCGTGKFTGYFGYENTYHHKRFTNVEWFAHDSNARGGNDLTNANTAQTCEIGQTMKLWITGSTAPWKIVTSHYPTRSSHTSELAALNWNWSGVYGVPLVLAGHAHGTERITSPSGYIACTIAMGGSSSFHGFSTPYEAGSFFRYERASIMRIWDTTSDLICEIYDTGFSGLNGDLCLLDRFKIKR